MDKRILESRASFAFRTLSSMPHPHKATDLEAELVSSDRLDFVYSQRIASTNACYASVAI